MTTQTRIAFTGIGQAALQTRPLRPLQDNEVLVRNDVSAISAGTERACLLDLPNLADSPPGQFPKYLGYSGVGRVVEVGRSVQGLAQGDRVLTHRGSCHADHNILHHENLIKIHDPSIPSEHAVFAIIAGFSLHGLRVARLEIGQSVAVAGLGVLGVFALALARLAGGVPVIGVDRQAARRRLAIRLGAHEALDPDQADLAARIRQATAGGAQVVIEVTGQSAALAQALGYTARFGRVSLLGCTRVADTAIDFYQAVHRPGIQLIGAHSMARPSHESRPHAWTWQDDARALLAFMADGRLDMPTIVSASYRPQEAPAVYQRLVNDPDFPIGAVFDWRD